MGCDFSIAFALGPKPRPLYPYIRCRRTLQYLIGGLVPITRYLSCQIILKQGASATLRARIAYIYVCRCYTVYIVFVGGRGYAKEMILVDLCLNIYVRDVVVFKLFAKAHPSVKNLYTTTTSLRRRCAAVYTFLRLLQQFINTIQMEHQQQLLGSQALPHRGAEVPNIEPRVEPYIKPYIKYLYIKPPYKALRETLYRYRVILFNI